MSICGVTSDTVLPCAVFNTHGQHLTFVFSVLLHVYSNVLQYTIADSAPTSQAVEAMSGPNLGPTDGPRGGSLGQ